MPDNEINLNLGPTPEEYYAANHGTLSVGGDAATCEESDFDRRICPRPVPMILSVQDTEIARETPEGEIILAEGETWESAFRKLWEIVKHQ